MRSDHADVVVVDAGRAGLVVSEARPGGRGPLLSHTLPGGEVVKMGGRCAGFADDARIDPALGRSD